MNTLENQEDDQSSTHSFSVVDQMFGHRNHQEKQDESSIKSTLEEPPVEEVAKVCYLDFSIGIYQNTQVPSRGPRRFYHDPVVIVDPKSVKNESNELCFKVKMGDPEIRALVLARLLSLESFANVYIQLNDISTMPYEEIRLLVKPGTSLKSIKLKEEPIPYYIRMKNNLDFHLKCDYSSVAAELVGEFKKSSEFVMDNWMLALECRGLALGTGCKPLEMMSTSKRRATWIFPISTLPCDFDQVARTQSVIDNLPPRLKGCEALIESLKNEIKEIQAKQQEAEDDDLLDRVSDLEGELEAVRRERLQEASSDAASKEREVLAKQFKDLQGKIQALISDYRSEMEPKQNYFEQQLLEFGQSLTTLTNRKLQTAIPIFAVRACTNPTASAGQSFGYKSHDFDSKTDHVQIDLPSGIFTVQTLGVYQLNFNSTIWMQSGNLTCHFELRVDGVARAFYYNHYTGSAGAYQPVLISALLHLNPAQKVGVFAVTGNLYDSGPVYTTRFSGVLYANDQ